MTPIEQKSVNTIRMLAADAVQQANSGHPGMPMGAAPMAYALFARVMRHNPCDPSWSDRDRFVLSAGHGSALLYAMLHLSGYDLPLDEVKRFRQLGSLTPGHPEYRHTPGVETTTGPLGQGIANAVGFAMAEAHLAAVFNKPGFPLVDHYTYAICGDGCLMEGISGEAASLAGTLKLSKLVLLYDDNEISIEGNTDLAFTENVPKRFEAYGWHVQKIEDGNDVDAIERALLAAKADPRPSLIVVPTQIGFGCPAKQGKASAHGEPLGADNLLATKKALGMPEEMFVVSDEVRDYMGGLREKGAALQAQWDKMLKAYAQKYPELYQQWLAWHCEELPEGVDSDALWAFEGKAATRNSSGTVLNRLAAKLPNLFGGSADLSPSNKSDMKGRGDFSAKDRLGANLHFGVREHAMSAISNGIALHGGLRAYCATFFVFTDYMKNAMRMSAIMKLPVTYILTHDSIGVGEDGPTHQPVEHLDGLRAVPNLLVFRPADSRETVAGWLTALTAGLPTCLVLTRQDLPLYAGSGRDAMRGGYVLSDCDNGTPDVLLMASGSEVEQMMQAQALLKDRGVAARVVSMPCMELFEMQDEAYRQSVLPKAVRARVAMEAGTCQSWHRYVGLDGAVIGMEGFGASGPAKQLFAHFGFTAENAVEKALALLK